MCICLVLLASGTASNVLVDKGGETQPPKLRCNKLAGLENTGMSCSGVIMVVGNNKAVEVGVGRDVDAILVGQDSSIVLPV